MKRFIVALSIVILAFAPLPTVNAASQNSKNNKETTDRVIVKVSQSKLVNRFLQYGSSMLEKKINLMTVEKPNNKSMAAFLKELKNQPGVLYAEPDYKVTLDALPNDPLLKNQWHHTVIQSGQAWNTTKGSPQTIVAVIDNGIDLKHPDLSQNIVKPFDIVANTNKKMPVGEHGTHVAGLIAAVHNNKIGGSGVSPAVKIMPVNVFVNDEAYLSDIIKGIQYAVKSGADVINMSLGMYESSKALNDAIQAAYKKGVLIVAAAGNEQTTRPSFPAALPNVLSVSSTTQFDKKSYFSNYGTTIDLSAPGSEITSTLPNNKYGAMSGTSMASPIVAGAAALVLSKEPKLTNEQVAYRLTSTANDLGAKGKDTSYGAGRVNVANALKYRLLANPVVSQLTDKDKAIRIQYKEAFKGKVIVTGKTRIEKQINSDRGFNQLISIPLQKGESIVSIKLVDEKGNESWPVKRKVKDATPPAAPKMTSIGDNSKIVQGKTEVGAKVTVRKGNAQLASGNANSAGDFKITMNAAQKAGSVLYIQATDKTGNKSPAVKAVVKDKTAPKLLNINKFTPSSTKVKGTTEPNANVVVKINNKVIGKGKANKSGSFSVTVKKQKVNTTMRVYLSDTAGNTSSYKLTVRK